VLYQVPFTLDGGTFTTSEPAGHGDLTGVSGDVVAMDGSGMFDDPSTHPGSGADRLRAGSDGVRVRVTVPVIDPCGSTMPPPECGMNCTSTSCPNSLICGPHGTCVGQCTIEMHPDAPSMVSAAPVADIHHSHEWAHVTFTVPASARGIASY